MTDQDIYIGTEGIHYLSDQLKKRGLTKVCFFTGRKSFDNSSFAEKIKNLFSLNKTNHYNDISPNPTIESLKDAIQFLQNDWDAVIAIGGGSVMDTAKIANYFAHVDTTIDNFVATKEFGELKNPPYFTAIPTTAGTGSESTQFSTFYVNKKKHSLDHHETLPSLVIIDSLFTSQLPQEITAQTGADALCQAIESFWNISSTEHSRELAKNAITILLDALPKVLAQPTDETRLLVAKAANMAGQAIQITRTTAPHAISYPMTSYFNIPHGQAVSLSLPGALEFNCGIGEADCNDPRGINFVKEQLNSLLTLINANSPQDANEKLTNFFKSLGLKTKLSELGIRPSDHQIILENGFEPSRVKNNPRLLTRKDLEIILTKIT